MWCCSQKLPDVAPVHTHDGNFGAAVLVEFISACLTAEAIQEELLAHVAVGQLQKRLPHLKHKRRIDVSGESYTLYFTEQSTETHKVVGGQRNVI